MSEMTRPSTKRELRKFLGAMGYYRDYIPQFARLAKLLTDLTSKRTPNVLQWGDEQVKAFQSLKAKLCDSHVLRIPLMGVVLWEWPHRCQWHCSWCDPGTEGRIRG